MPGLLYPQGAVLLGRDQGSWEMTGWAELAVGQGVGNLKVIEVSGSQHLRGGSQSGESGSWQTATRGKARGLPCALGHRSERKQRVKLVEEQAGAV